MKKFIAKHAYLVTVVVAIVLTLGMIFGVENAVHTHSEKAHAAYEVLRVNPDDEIKDEIREWIKNSFVLDKEYRETLEELDGTFSSDTIQRIAGFESRRFELLGEYWLLVEQVGHGYRPEGGEFMMVDLYEIYMKDSPYYRISFAWDSATKKETDTLLKSFGDGKVVAANRTWNGVLRAGDILCVEDKEGERHIVTLL